MGNRARVPGKRGSDEILPLGLREKVTDRSRPKENHKRDNKTQRQHRRRSHSAHSGAVYTYVVFVSLHSSVADEHVRREFQGTLGGKIE